MEIVGRQVDAVSTLYLSTCKNRLPVYPSTWLPLYLLPVYPMLRFGGLLTRACAGR